MTDQFHFHFSLFTFMHWRRKWQPTPVLLPGESQGWGSLVGCRLWGHTELDMAAATAAAAYVAILCVCVCMYIYIYNLFISSATGLEKVSFYSNPKKSNAQRMLTLSHNCIHLTC